METQLVTCPETGEREEIDCLTAGDGEILVVLRCSRFDPPEAMVCTSGCAHARSCRIAGRDPWRLPVEVTAQGR